MDHGERDVSSTKSRSFLVRRPGAELRSALLREGSDAAEEFLEHIAAVVGDEAEAEVRWQAHRNAARYKEARFSAAPRFVAAA